MPTTTYAGLRYPQNSDGPFGPQQIQNLATDVDTKVIVPVATPTARTALTGVPDGVMVYEQSTKRYYRRSSTAPDGSGWSYAGGNPPPIVACGAGAGWGSPAGHPPGCYLDSSGLVHLVGAVVPNTTYNPQDGGTHTAVTIPSGYRPASGAIFPIVVPYPVNGAVFLQIDTGGIGSIVGGTTASVGPNSGHYLDGVVYHPGYAGTVPFS